MTGHGLVTARCHLTSHGPSRPAELVAGQGTGRRSLKKIDPRDRHVTAHDPVTAAQGSSAAGLVAGAGAGRYSFSGLDPAGAFLVSSFMVRDERYGTREAIELSPCFGKLFPARWAPSSSAPSWCAAYRLSAFHSLVRGHIGDAYTPVCMYVCLLLVRPDYIRPRPRARPRRHGELLKLLRYVYNAIFSCIDIQRACAACASCCERARTSPLSKVAPSRRHAACALWA